MFTVQAVATLLALSSTALAVPPPVPVADFVQQQPKSMNISLPVDHFNKSDSRRYNNRYWFEDRYYKPGGPVFFYDFGEGPASLSDATSVLEPFSNPDYVSAVLKLAQLHNGLAVAWEHRYFGYSLPCPLDANGVANVDPNCEYQVNTIDQALEDVVYFANKPNFVGYNATQLKSMAANNSPWVFIGGSYPGARAAWIRQRNPETIYASWASSAVVAPLEDGSSYYNTEARVRQSNCTADMNAALVYIDSTLTSSDASAALDMRKRVATTLQAISNKNTTEISTTDANSYTDENLTPQIVDYFLGDFQSSGPGTILRFCDLMEAFNLQQAPSTARINTILNNSGNGKVTSNGLKGQGASNLQLANALLYATYAPYKNQSPAGSAQNDVVAKKYGLERFAKPMPLAPRDNSEAPATGYGDGGNWYWIVQNEFGVYESSSVDYFKLQSGKIALSKWENQTTTRQDYYNYFAQANVKNIPQHPNVTQCLKYGGWKINPSNVMWTTGTLDPWRPYTPLTIDQELGAPTRVPPTTNVPACNVAPNQATPFGLVYPNGMHAADLFGYMSTDTVGQGIAAFDKALKTWLPCFKPH